MGATDGIDGRYGELLSALAALPPRQRAVLVLRYFLDLPEAEVAAALKCSLGTVKSTASRGLARLEQALRTSNDTRSIPT
jgi:RNA polymerase sigma factor (sigma-70 family)